MIAEFTAEEKQGKEIKVETKKRLYGVMKAKDGVDDLQKVLSDFCEKYGVERNTINIFDVGELNAENRVREGGEIDYAALEKELTVAERFTRLREMGLDVDFEEKVVSLAMFTPQFMSLLQKYLNSEQGYAVRLVNLEDKKEYKTKFFITSADMRSVQELYLQFLSRQNY
jgi:ribosomal protein L20A (L18A)